METGDYVRLKGVPDKRRLAWPLTTKMKLFKLRADENKLLFRVHSVNLKKNGSISSIQLRECINFLWDPLMIELVKSIDPKKRVNLWLKG